MSFLLGVRHILKAAMLGMRTYQDLQGPLHVAHVKDVSVMVFRRHGKVIRFHWVPGEAVGGEVEDSAVKR